MTLPDHTPADAPSSVHQPIGQWSALIRGCRRRAIQFGCDTAIRRAFDENYTLAAATVS